MEDFWRRGLPKWSREDEEEIKGQRRNDSKRQLGKRAFYLRRWCEWVRPKGILPKKRKKIFYGFTDSAKLNGLIQETP